MLKVKEHDRLAVMESKVGSGSECVDMLSTYFRHLKRVIDLWGYMWHTPAGLFLWLVIWRAESWVGRQPHFEQC